MKIALCYESMMPHQGGCETYIADLARCLAHDNHEVHLFASKFDTEAFPDSVMHHLLPPATGPRFWRPWAFARSCYQALQQHTFDVTVGFIKTWGQDVLMPQGGFHLASAEHNVRKHSSPFTRAMVRLLHAIDLKHWSYRRLERKQLFDFKSTIVVPSRMVQQHAHQYYPEVTDRVRVVHNAIDADRFSTQDRLKIRSQVRDQNRLHPEDHVGLFVGHNYRLKGLVPLLHATRLIPDSVNFKLLICGSAKYQRYEKMAENLGISERVRFLGFVPEVREAFFAADFLVHPSFYDPCALVTMEALTCGLPVITTKLNGGSEQLPACMNSLTVDSPHDHEAMARNIERLCHAESRAVLSRAARETALRWTFNDHYRALLAIFEEVARSKRPHVLMPRPGKVS